MIRWTGKKCILGLPISFTTYILTDDKLVESINFLTFRENELRLYRIKDIELVRTLWQKILKTGDIKTYTSDRTSSENNGVFILKNIKNSKAVKDMLSDLVEKQVVSHHIGVLNDD